MRIAPRTLLCGNAFRVHADISGGLFDELRELCSAAGDKASLAIGMAGLVGEHMMRGRMREASRLASETMALIESIGDPTLDGRAVHLADRHQVSDRRDGRGAALVADRHRPGRRRTRQGQLHFRVAVGVGAGHARHRPMGAGPCGLARRPTTGRWPWPAAPTRCRMPRSSHSPTVPAIPRGVLLADDCRAARHRGGAARSAERSSEDLALGLARVHAGRRAGASGLPGGA